LAQVDLNVGTVRLEPGTTKNGQGRVLPFGAHPELAQLLRAQREEATTVERARVPRSVAMKLTGHLMESIHKRYAIVSKPDLAEGVAKLAESHIGTNVAQPATRTGSASPSRIGATR
jgi:hypothetical protein